MKNVCLLLCLFFYKNLAAQNFRPLRADDDFSYLKNDSTRHRNFYKKLKYSTLGEKKAVQHSLGGELRVQHQFFRNEDWGEVPSDRAGFLLTRAMLHSDWHLGKRWRVFGQLTSNFEAGRADPNKRGIDQNPLDLHQFFADFQVKKRENTAAWLRLGRQEMLYGSQRLVSVREGPNVRQTFDGGKFVFQKNGLRADAFFTWFVPTRPLGVFDDPFDARQNQRLWGAYLVKNQVPFFKNLDFYYLGYRSPRRRYDEGTAQETRHSVGTRIWGKTARWNWDFEALGQWGEFGGGQVRAWTLSSNTRFSATRRAVLGLKTEVISGDRRAGDGRLESFNPLFPRGGYFGLAALVGPSNLFDLHPSLSLELSPRLSFEADFDVFWRLSLGDGIYGPVGQFVRSGQATRARRIGEQWTAQLEWQPNPFLKLGLEAAYFHAGPFLRTSGAGENLFFTAATAGLKF